MKIIIATDGSEYSRAAIEKGCELVSKAAHLEIKIVSVYQMFIPLDSFPQSVQYTEGFEEAMREQAKKHADDAVESLMGIEVEHVGEAHFEVMQTQTQRFGIDEFFLRARI